MPTEPTWWESFKELLDIRFDHLDERFGHVQTALELQAREYERRLEDLNGAHKEAIRVQHTYVTVDKYEDRMLAQELARQIAVDRLDEQLASTTLRTDEKLEDYIKRYEVRQREIDQALDISKGASDAAQRISEEQGRKTNRNMALMGLALTIIIAAANWLGGG